LLGSITQTLGDNEARGTKDEDRFFGITSAVGIKRIRLAGGPGIGIEIDHLQYGNRVAETAPPPPDLSVVPLLAGMPLLVGAFGLMAVLRRRRR
jgi:hypothetical protein